MSTSRTSLRQSFRAARRSLSERQQRAAAEQVCTRLLHADCWRRARRIALYWPADGELETWPLLREAWASGRQVFMPCLDPLGSRRLQFRPLQDGARLGENRFGIPEPESALDTAPLWSLQLVLVPLVAFDRDGHRLGMGGGYYDATLAALRARPHLPRPTLVGLAHGCQLTGALTQEPQDVAMDWILTPHAWHRGQGPGS